jgi:HTH-type transcriptional regulator/antitoxin HigA
MEIRPIRTEDDYQAALREVSAFLDQEPEPGSPEGDRIRPPGPR